MTTGEQPRAGQIAMDVTPLLDRISRLADKVVPPDFPASQSSQISLLAKQISESAKDVVDNSAPGKLLHATPTPSRLMELVIDLEELLTPGDDPKKFIDAAVDTTLVTEDIYNVAFDRWARNPEGKSNPGDVLYQIRQKIRNLQVLRESLRSLDKDVSTASIDSAAQHAEEAAGRQGTASLAQHFDKFADEEHGLVMGFRALAGALILATVIASAWLLMRHGGTLTWPAEIAKVAATSPIYVFAYYLLRQAGYHRDASQRAKENAVRLKTIRAYTDELPREDMLKLRAELGRRVFAEQAGAIEDDVSPIDAEAASKLLASVTGLIAAARK